MKPTYNKFRIGAVETGARGKPGKSVYELWLENGNKGTMDEFLNAMRGKEGKQGRPGIKGENAYEIWRKQPGNEGKTEQDFLNSMKGDKGDKGDKGGMYVPSISSDGVLSWCNDSNLENPQPFNISDLILNEVKESRIDTNGKSFSKLKERLDSDFKKLSESIKNNDTKDEVVQARTATTGENFTTLDDRIDHEVIRLREKIEVTMLEQEDKENHVIENTVEGLTTDMIIKGRTLQNIIKTETFGNAQICSYELRDGYYNITELTNPPNKGAMVFDLKLSKKIMPNNTYTCIVLDKSISNKYLLRDNINAENITSVKSGNIFTFSVKKESDFILLYYYDIVVGDRIKENQNIIILEGDWTNKPIPQYFEGIKSFGQQEDKISILSSGKNLLNFKSFENYIKNTHENEILYPIKLKPNTNYTFSYKTGEWNGKGAFLILKDKDKKEVSRLIDSNVGNRKSISFTTNNNTNYYLFTYKNNIDKFNSISSNYQIEEGSQATFYEPYQSYKKDILLQDLGFDEGLRGLNNVSDELNSAKGVAIKRVEKYELTGDENWSTNSNVENEKTLYFYTDTLDNLINKTHINNIICNTLPTLSNYDSTCVLDSIFNTNGSNNIRVRISKSKLTSPDLAGFRAWLKANPTVIYYELAEPVETPLYENINLKTFNERTYVSFENAISGTSSFKVPVNTNKLINDLKFEKEELKEKFNNLTNEFEKFKTLMIQTLPYKEEE